MARIRLLHCLLLLLAAAATAQNQSGQQRTTADVSVRVVDDNGRPVASNHRVQLITASGISVSESSTREGGEARFYSIHGGNYRVRITGPEVEDTVTDTTFHVDPQSTPIHFETVTAKLRPLPQGNTFTLPQGMISAAQLNIPEKARKEFDKGSKALKAKDFKKAEMHFLKAVEIYPQYAAAFNNLGVIAMHNQDREAGERYFMSAIAADEHSAAAHFNLAKARLSRRNHAGVEEALTKTLSIDPGNATALLLLAQTQLRLGKVAEATASANRVHSLPHEQLAIAHLLAARAYEHAGLPQEAISQYREFQQESPGSPLIPATQAAIQALQQKLR